MTKLMKVKEVVKIVIYLINKNKNRKNRKYKKLSIAIKDIINKIVMMIKYKACHNQLLFSLKNNNNKSLEKQN